MQETRECEEYKEEKKEFVAADNAKDETNGKNTEKLKEGRKYKNLKKSKVWKGCQ